jgi:hypothetical protein
VQQEALRTDKNKAPIKSLEKNRSVMAQPEQ